MKTTMNIRKALTLFVLALLSATTFGQGLENIIVETYYVSDADDATDTDGGSLATGSVTYRIYVDMAAGYELQAVYGNNNHALSIATTTQFFNNVDRGEIVGRLIPDNRIDENTVALDSWIAMGGATTLRLGIPKASDPNGSLVGGVNNDGGSAGVSGGLLTNNDPLAGIPLTTADGLISGVGPTVTVVGLDLSMFDSANSSVDFLSNGGAWSVLEGVQGNAPDNIILIGQFTTTGELSFELNLQLGAPGGGTEQYVASNPTGAEQFFAGLTFPGAPGCTDAAACNYDAAATTDDGSCTYPGCTNPIACNFNALAGCDDGSCTFPGCTNPSACNYNASAGCDDGSCTLPGCTNALACNYDSEAGCDNGSCIVPVPNCSACNGTNTGLVIVDTDGDGICNANEIAGCTNITASNYNPLATDDNGSCTYPSVTACDGNIGGLEDVIIETYYVSDANDATDTDGGSLVAGSTTYRIYMDLAPGYELQAVYGNNDHELRIETSTLFFNNVDRGEQTGNLIPQNRIDENTVALDSWVGMNGATTARLGVLKSEDADGSLVGGVNNDGGSAGIAGGLLVNADPGAGIALTTADGLIVGTVPSVTNVGLNLSVFDNANAGPVFSSTGGAWSVLEGVQGPTATNRVLVAQITTDGELSFDLNVQLGTPTGGTEKYVASNALSGERQCDALHYEQVVIIAGCTDCKAPNYNALANFDDGSCITSCPGDFSFDGVVGATDLLIFLGTFGSSGPCIVTDLNSDTLVGLADLLIFLGAYGSSCP
jgi:hypothetical protein